MTDMRFDYTIGVPQRSWTSDAIEADIAVVVGIRGRAPLTAVLAYLAEQGVDVERVGITFGSLRWHTRPTEDEYEQRVAARRAHVERQEAWERQTYTRLKAKFGSEEDGR